MSVTKKLGLTAALLAFLLAPTAGWAKGPGLDHSSLDGPGIERPIVIANRQPYLLNEVVMSHLFGTPHDPGFSADRPIAADLLGPRFALRYHLGFGREIDVDFYPYAAHGPLGYVPAGQFAYTPFGTTDEGTRWPARSGWYEYPPALIWYLRDLGMPSASVAEAATTGPWPGIAVLSAAAVATAALVVCGRAIALRLLRTRRFRAGRAT